MIREIFINGVKQPQPTTVIETYVMGKQALPLEVLRERSQNFVSSLLEHEARQNASGNSETYRPNMQSFYHYALDILAWGIAGKVIEEKTLVDNQTLWIDPIAVFTNQANYSIGKLLAIAGFVAMRAQDAIRIREGQPANDGMYGALDSLSKGAG